MTRRTRLDRLRAVVEFTVAAVATPATEVWLPAKDGGRGQPPSRYPQPGGRMVLVLYRSDEADPPGSDE